MSMRPGGAGSQGNCGVSKKEELTTKNAGGTKGAGRDEGNEDGEPRITRMTRMVKEERGGLEKMRRREAHGGLTGGGGLA